jgi:hypothetical protein
MVRLLEIVEGSRRLQPGITSSPVPMADPGKWKERKRLVDRTETGTR